jgi:hypothetical protein
MDARGRRRRRASPEKAPVRAFRCVGNRGWRTGKVRLSAEGRLALDGRCAGGANRMFASGGRIPLSPLWQ